MPTREDDMREVAVTERSPHEDGRGAEGRVGA
jgi:hypothetical protein